MKLFTPLKATAALATVLTIAASSAMAAGEPLDQVVNTGVRDCSMSTNVNMPIIAWGADAVTMEANGGALKTQSGSLLDKAGWKVTLSVKDNFKGQVEDFLSCKSPFLRGTLGMLTAAAPLTENDPRTEQVIFFKHSWSAGDGIAAVAGINKVSDLKGKRVAVQAYGPHLDFLARILDDAGLSLKDVNLIWTNDLTGTSDSPAEVMARGDANVAAMILPDARILTSGGAVGTGAEGSIKGATILFSTMEATAVIGDYIAVRKDFFDANQDAIGKMVNALFQAEEDTRITMAGSGAEKSRISTMIADTMLGGLPAEEGAFLWMDAVTDGWPGNAKHFGSPKDPRRFEVLSGEVSKGLMDADMINLPYELATAEWDYNSLTDGLDNLSEREIAAFNAEAAASIVKTLRKTGQLDANTKIDFQVFFEPGTPNFPVHLYEEDFEEIIRLAATYSGAIITVEGHSDPLHFLKEEKRGAKNDELQAIRTSAKNLSMDRAQAVVTALNDYADSQDISLNTNQFTVDGVGITEPAFNPPTTKEEWRQNMRVKFRVLTTQAEATEFSPL